MEPRKSSSAGVSRPQRQPALMGAFQQRAAARNCTLVALTTLTGRALFHRAPGYEKSAVYLPKIIDEEARE